VFSAEVRDGQGNVLHKRLYVTQTSLDGRITIKQPTIFLDLSPAPVGTETPYREGLPDRNQLESVLIQETLNSMLEEVRKERDHEIKTITEHMEISLHTLIDKVQCQFADLQYKKDAGSTEAGLDGRLKMLEDRMDELNNRLEKRLVELQKEKQCSLSNIQHIGSAWVLPHPERQTPTIKHMISDPEIERIAIQTVKDYEESRGWVVQSVEDENRGFDLISRKPHPEDPETAIEVRFIEVKGRAYVGEVALTTNEYKTAERLKKDYWLYVVFNCSSTPDTYIVQDPSQLGWKPIVKIEHYHVSADEIFKVRQ